MISGPIRKMIGPAKAHLQQYVESVNSLLENKPKEQELDEYEIFLVGSQHFVA